MTQGAAPAQKSAFSFPIYREVWFASLASNFGGLIQSVGAAWMMTMLGSSARMIAATTIPIVLFALWAGAVADNLDRRKVMLAAQAFMLVTSMILAILAWQGMLSPGLLLFFTFAIACGAAVNGPAWQASVGDMVPRDVLPSAVALNAMGFNVARSLGPAIGGVIVAAVGAAAAFLVNAVSYIGLIIVLMRWNPSRPERSLPRERIGDAMVAGVRYIAMSPSILTVLARATVFGIGASAIPSLMPLVARDLVGGGPLTYGVLLGGFGVGAVAGALATRRFRGIFSTEWVVRLASFGMALGAGIAALSGSVFITLPALAICGAGWVVALSTFNVSVQIASPRWVVARALSLYQMSAFGGMAIGSWLAGELADGRGTAVALAGAGLELALVAVIGLRWQLPEIADLDLSPQNRWRQPETVVPIQMRSGPIVVSIEHRISVSDSVAFLVAMNERRRIRLRDGARQWHLMRDLADPELWVERYQFPTWLDYVRHNERRTKADAANSEALERLRFEQSEPVVRRMIERQVSALPITSANLESPGLGEPLTDPSRSA
jgi:MFS family permease